MQDSSLIRNKQPAGSAQVAAAERNRNRQKAMLAAEQERIKQQAAQQQTAPEAAQPAQSFPINPDRLLDAMRVCVTDAKRDPYVNGNDEAEYLATRDVIKEALKRVDQLRAMINSAYADYLAPSGPAISTRKYITKDRQIQANLVKNLRNRQFFPIIEHLYQNRLSLSATISMGFGTMTAGGKKGHPVVCKPDVPAIAAKIGRSESQVHKYLQGMEAAGFIGRVPDAKKHTVAGSYYVLGIWGKNWFDTKGNRRRPKPSWFINSSPEVIQRLRTWRRPD